MSYTKVPTAEEPTYVEAAEVQAPAASWHGNLLSCCGPSCGDWGWCCLSSCLPSVAFGMNMRRAFKLNLFLQAVVFILLFGGISRIVNTSVEAACPMFKEDPNAPAKPSSETVVHSEGHDPEVAVAFVEVDAELVTSEPEASEAEAEEQPNTFFAALLEAVSPLVDGKTRDGAVEELNKQGRAAKKNNRKAGDKHDEEPGHGFAPLDKDGNPMVVNEECAPWHLLSLVGVLAVGAGTVYAASRRTQIRELLGIEGSPVGDLCAWLWCAGCALCQETRTLAHHRVVDGVVHGPHDPAAAAAVAPQMVYVDAPAAPAFNLPGPPAKA